MSIGDRVSAKRKARFEQSPQWSLGQLINALARVNAAEDCWVSFTFGDFVPTDCDSWRGSYDEIAIGYAELVWEKRPMLKDFLEHLRHCIGREFSGWKGGEFVMDENTPVWVANPGHSGSCGVVGICEVTGAEGKAYRVYICTNYCEF